LNMRIGRQPSSPTIVLKLSVSSHLSSFFFTM
jgi:hypothetical protein